MWGRGAAGNSRTKLPHTTLCGSHRWWKISTWCQLPNGMLGRVFLPGEDCGKRVILKRAPNHTLLGETARQWCQKRMVKSLYPAKGSMDFMDGIWSPFLPCDNTVFVPLFCTFVSSTMWGHLDVPSTKNRPLADVEPDSCTILKIIFFINWIESFVIKLQTN